MSRCLVETKMNGLMVIHVQTVAVRQWRYKNIFYAPKFGQKYFLNSFYNAI